MNINKVDPMLGQLRQQDNPSIITYNTEAGLRIWKSALAQLESGTQQIFNIVCLGDSITEGAATTNYQTQGYVGLIRANLAAKFGNVGIGMIPCWAPYNAPALTFSSGWSKTNNSVWGIMGNAWSTSQAGQTISGSFTGTGVNLYVVGGNSTGTLNIVIDSGTSTPYSTHSASINPEMCISITGLSAGTHTISMTTANTSSVYFTGMMPTMGTVGVQVNNLAYYGCSSNQGIYGVDNLKMQADIYSPVLTTIAFGANDYTGNVLPSTYASNIQQYITRAKMFGDVLLIANGIRTDVGTYPQAQYTAQLLSLTQQNNCAFIDINTRWNNSFTYAMNTLKLATTGATVHPNVAGHQDAANAILNVLYS